jgi:hypothetical protein
LVSPEWLTPTAKGKAIVRLVLGLRFAHSLGLLHGCPTGSNAVFNGDGVNEIADFCVNRLMKQKGKSGRMIGVCGFFGEDWTPDADIWPFAEILSEIILGGLMD